MKTQKSTRQNRSKNHSSKDSEASKLAASIAPSRAPDNDSAEKPSDWPSQSIAESMLKEVRKHVKLAHQLLTTNGFRVVGDPLNRVGDGRTWIVIVEPTARMLNSTDPMGLARSILENAGMVNDPYKLDLQDAGDRSFRIVLAPPSKAAIPVRAPMPLRSVDSEDLQKGHGIDPAFLTTPVPSSQTFADWKARNGEELTLEPTLEKVLGKAFRQAKRLFASDAISGSRIEIGKWADQRLKEGVTLAKLVRSGRKPGTLRDQFPEFFSEVVDKLREPRRRELFEQAERSGMTSPQLMNYIAESKGFGSGSTLNDYRKEYRSHASSVEGVALVLPPSNPPKKTPK